jgi:hypothetical protein
MGYQYNAYPFDMTEHVVYILKKLLEAHDDWGYESEPIYLIPFKDGYTPSRVKDTNLASLLRYLEERNVIQIITLTDKEFFNWVKTPIASVPKMKVNTRWKIKIVNQDKVRSLAHSIEIRLREFNKTDLRCDLHVENNKLYLSVNKELLELKQFNNRGAIDVFKRLVIERAVTRDKDGYISGKGVSVGLPVGSLSDVIRNAGFRKKVRKWLFIQCENNIIELKTPLYLEGEEINHILDDFVKNESKNGEYIKNKNRDTLSNALSRTKNNPS